MRDFTLFTCVVCFLLGGFVATCEAQVIIYTPPGNTTACRSSNVTINCGYISGTPFPVTALPVTWIINGTSFDEASLMNSSLYQLNNPTVLTQYSLELFSINLTTTFQCIVHATNDNMKLINITSTRGTVTVIDVPVVEITTATGGCGYVRVSWAVPDDNDACPVHQYTIKLLSSTMDELASVIINKNQHTFSGLSNNTLFYVTVFSHYAYVDLINFVNTSVRTMDLKDPIPINVMANVKISNDISIITISWQLPSCTTANIMKYNITVMDQYSPASVTVPANMSSVEISEFPDNGTSVVANREYTITVSAISDQGTSYPSKPVAVSVNTNNGDSDSNSGGSSAGAVAGGVIGGIIAVVVIVIIIIIVIYYFGFHKKKSKSLYHDDTMNLKSPTSTGGSHTSGGDAYYDKAVYSDPSQTMTIPHQTSATGDVYAVSIKATSYVNQEQQPSKEYDDTCDTKKDTQGVTYADLQVLPTASERNMLNDLTPAVTYSEIAQ